ncbi:hypothetical protein GGR53DRAFT_467960 [Hypoxylon sp. FL1150]|nr:hypothetical protein GGR53DRAFT_467960 [Hypoxylon sp. FL1150]
MLASLIFEKHNVRKSDIAFFSIIRDINDGPRKLAELVAYSRQGIFRMESLLVFCLVISTLALQFSSTILFSDLREISIAGNSALFSVHDYVKAGIGNLYV